MFVLLFTGRWRDCVTIYKWMIDGELTIKEVDVEIMSERKFWE
jgi:hypothetical protein